ncbi:MAG: hypothetical protein AAGB46_17370 [Verrucomicrobiota bacterium]
MSRNFLEQRIIKAGIELSERNVEVKGAPITADSIRMLRVKTMSPGLQAMYSIIGLSMIGISIWIYAEVPHNMMISLVMMIGGVGNLVFAGNGKPKQVSQLEDKVDLMDLTGEIVSQFVKMMDEKRNSEG